MKFSEHLTYFRERNKLTKTSLAEKVGVTQTTIGVSIFDEDIEKVTY